MEHGRIDQAGTANEIFNRPTTPYVARFMGGQNVLTGTVESASSCMARLRGPRGEIFDAPSSPASTIGTPVSIAVRRDRIHVGRAPGEKTELQPNSVAGVVESTEFQGNFVKVNILVEGGGPFVANVSDEEYFAELVKPGGHVAPRWNPEPPRGQMGPISRKETRAKTVGRLIAMLREANGRGANLVVFTEMALMTFFPRWVIEDEAELDSFYEKEMPGLETAALFEEARKLDVGFYLGYAEVAREGNQKRRFNLPILVDRNGAIVGKYRKVHLPGHSEP